MTCRHCTSEFVTRSGLCPECAHDEATIVRQLAQVHAAPVPAMDPFDAFVAECKGQDRYQEEAAKSIARQKRGGSASVASYLAAGGPLALTPEGQREALALGLVHYKTTGRDTSKGRLSIEIDPLLARAQRLKKSTITSARLHDEEIKASGFRGAWYMLTLTYREGSRNSPDDIKNLLRFMRRHFNASRRSARRFTSLVFRYLWVGELTKRGIPHYHLLVWVPRGMYFGKVDQKGWWPHGSSQIEKARNAVGYLAKYASKFTSIVAGAFPKGFRTHGCGGLNNESKRELRWWKAPVTAREVLGPSADIRKALGGWFDKVTGEFWPSPWRVTILGGRVFAWKMVDIC